MPLTNLGNTYKKLLIPFSFIITLLVLYMIDPLSFQEAWKGRAFYLFFLWLFALEFILGGKPKPKVNVRTDVARMVGGFFMLMIPTIYVLEFYLFGLNNTIAQFGKFLTVGQGFSLSDQSWMINSSFPLSLEYFIITVSLFIGTLLLLDFEGIKQFSISLSFPGLIGVFYMIDTFRPYGTASIPNFLSPTLSQNGVSIQGFVPLISSIASFFLQKLGYVVQPLVVVQNAGVLSGGVRMVVNGVPFLVYWPCAGVYSLFIYTFVILLFLKGSPMSLLGKLGCFVIGAVGTFFVNIMRIISIINIYVTQGFAAGEIFHNYYGELFFLAWIVLYLFALVFLQRFLLRRKTKNS